MNRKKIIFITGATAGFGKAIAYKFAQHGYDLILNGRREDRLRKIPSGKILVDEETGEVMIGPSKTSKSSYKVTLLKQ